MKLNRANASDYGDIYKKIGNDYPESAHPYAEGDNYVWLYKYTPAEHSNQFYLILNGISWGNTYGFKFDNVTTIGDETIVTSILNYKNLDVTKKWEDQGYESYRPSEVIYDIYDSNDLNTIVRTVTLNSSNQIDSNTWKITVENLPKYDSNGQEIKYTIKERPIENYLSLNDYSEYYNGLSIKFSEDTDYNFYICYEKNTDGSYTCLDRHQYHYEATANSKDSSSGSFVAGRTINIPSHDLYLIYYQEHAREGKKIKIEDITPMHFANTERQSEIGNNRVKVEYIEASFNDYIDIVPYNYNEYVPEDESIVYHYEWKGTLEQKPNSDTVRNLINLKNIPFTKIWNDAGMENKRPNEIKFRIYNEKDLNTIVKEITLTNSNQDLNDSNIWNGEFTNIPKYNEDGTEANYIIKEEELEKYKTTYDLSNKKGLLVAIDDSTYVDNYYYFQIPNNSTNNLSIKYNIINSISFRKKEGSNRTLYVPIAENREAEFIIYLKNTENSYGIKINNIIPTDQESDTYSYMNGTSMGDTINFYGDNFPETTHPFNGYTYLKYIYEPLSNSFVGANVIINTIDVKDLLITKKWDDIGQEEYRPEKVTIDIYNSNDLNTIIKTVELNNDNKLDNYTWQTTVELPKTDDNNQELNYIFKERKINNYETTYTTTREIKGMDIHFETINTTSGAPIYVCYSKNNRYYCKEVFSTENINVQVPSRDFDIALLPGYTKNVKITNISPVYSEIAEYSQGSNYSQYLNEYATGEDYLNFSSEERTITQPLTWHYTLGDVQYTEPKIYTDTVVNKALFKTIEIEKEWIDTNYEVLRPNSIKVNILKNNEIIKEVNLTKEENYKTTVTLPKYENGNEIEYDVEEENLKNYNTTYTKENNKVTITNEIILKDVIISKLDEEKNNLKGAILSIITETGNEVLEFTTEEKDTTIKLPKGQFILHEKKAPKGYLSANNISFNLDEKLTINNEEVEKIIMIDKYQKNPTTIDNINNYIKILVFIISMLLFVTVIKKNEEKLTK